MANLLFGKVYYQDHFAGYLRQEPGERYTFTYDSHYLESSLPAIAHTLPLQESTFVQENALPAFFDNLVAEGWLEQAQSRLLGKRQCNRFELLLAFGAQCMGCISIVDPDPARLLRDRLDNSDPVNVAIYKNRASISGVQPKVLLRKKKDGFEIAAPTEFSTHIAKLPSSAHPDIVYNEYVTWHACRAMVPEDDFVELELTNVAELADEVLVIKRFDRGPDQSKKHFEEFNQLLGLQSRQKYDGHYADMTNFIDQTPQCLPSEKYRLFKRVLMAILTGNTDMHFKNFAMFHTPEGLRLTPNYDQVAAALYPPYRYMALTMANKAEWVITKLKAKHIVMLGEEFGLPRAAIAMAVKELEQRLGMAQDAVAEVSGVPTSIKDQLNRFMEKRWNGTFHSIGQQLSKKR